MYRVKDLQTYKRILPFFESRLLKNYPFLFLHSKLSPHFRCSTHKRQFMDMRDDIKTTKRKLKVHHIKESNCLHNITRPIAERE